MSAFSISQTLVMTDLPALPYPTLELSDGVGETKDDDGDGGDDEDRASVPATAQFTTMSSHLRPSSMKYVVP